MDKGFFNFDDRLPVESLMLNTSSSTYGSSNAFSILKFGFISSRHSALGTPTMCIYGGDAFEHERMHATHHLRACCRCPPQPSLAVRA